MRFVADESVDAAIVFRLIENKYNVFAIAEQCPGIEDEEVIMSCIRRELFLKDFDTEQKKDNAEEYIKSNPILLGT